MAFKNLDEAKAWVLAQLGPGYNEYVDNWRHARTDDVDAMRDYDKQSADGCCGSFDALVIIACVETRIGCNYGH